MNEARLAAEHIAEISRGSVLIAGFGGDQLPNAALAAGAEHVSVALQDVRSFAATERVGSTDVDVRYGPWPAVSLLVNGTPRSAHFDGAMVLLPREVDRLRMLLASIRPALADGAPVVLVGHNDTGIRPAGRHMAEFIGDAETLAYRYHCRALLARATVASRPFEPRTWRRTFTAEGLRLCTLPGVFSHGRLDDGTAMLIAALSLTPSARVLDVGCGSGVLMAHVARHVDGKVHGVDVDAVALVATAWTVAANDLEDRTAAWPSDGLRAVDERYTHIVSNPPFHAGSKTAHDVAVRLIEEAPQRLERRGELWLVANRFLPYGDALERAFAAVDVVTEDRRYRVWRARRA